MSCSFTTRGTHRAHCLSATAARVWRACDGKRKADGLGLKIGLDP